MTMTMEVCLLSKLYKNQIQNNQQCKYMHDTSQKLRQMVKHSSVNHNLDKGGRSNDLRAPANQIGALT